MYGDDFEWWYEYEAEQRLEGGIQNTNPTTQKGDTMSIESRTNLGVQICK